MSVANFGVLRLLVGQLKDRRGLRFLREPWLSSLSANRGAVPSKQGVDVRESFLVLMLPRLQCSCVKSLYCRSPVVAPDQVDCCCVVAVSSSG